MISLPPSRFCLKVLRMQYLSLHIITGGTQFLFNPLGPLTYLLFHVYIDYFSGSHIPCLILQWASSYRVPDGEMGSKVR